MGSGGEAGSPCSRPRHRSTSPALTVATTRTSHLRTSDIVSPMDVFVIPVAADRYELYYEQQTEEAEPDDEPASTGYIARLQRRFGELLRAAEDHQHHRDDQAEAARSWTGRMQDRMMSWIAKRIAEQRL